MHYFIIGLSEKEFLTKDFGLTLHLSKAYTFKTLEDAIAYEERNGNKIDYFTEIFEIKDNKITQIT